MIDFGEGKPYMKTSTAQWREKADVWFEKIYTHPYVQGLAKGEVKSESLIFYVAQDRAYLDSYMKICGLGIAKSEERQDVRFFHQMIQSMLNEENQAHGELLRQAGGKEEDLEKYPLSSTSKAYMNHMMVAGYQGGLADLLAALLPCPWTYHDLATRILEEHKIDDDHPFAGWIRFYGNDSAMTDQMRERLDECLSSIPSKQSERLYRCFEESCRLEWEFWEAAYTLRV